MAVMTADEATKAGALEKLAAAEAALEVARDAQVVARHVAAAATEAWADKPGPETKAAQTDSWRALEKAGKTVEAASVAHYGAIVAAHGGRVEFEGSDEFAELETRPTHGEYVELMKSTARMTEAKFEDKFAVIAEYVAILLRDWKVLDREGAELPRSVEGLAKAPYDRMRPISERATAIFRSMPNPNL